ncbi:hypothetical protein [Leekyejoonella antrihumi]|uniref:Uncharacterized protein n=1 Tax=Leekyejoonella antrihumi TaxID=1660198 RepID=A0A563DWU8_9MICO|nr:hypothetical protein [Leekyejoonella antrihumi]TWP34412.1 hypothetical protein FGL98_17740 [Leekyejoonella antrihumi]
MVWFIVGVVVALAAVTGGCWLALYLSDSRKQELANIDLERRLAEMKLNRLTNEAIRQIFEATRLS